VAAAYYLLSKQVSPAFGSQLKKHCYGYDNDSNDLIVGKQKLLCSVVTLKANGPQNVYMATIYGSFGAKNLFAREKICVQY
jgi:hypothetical protein